MVPGGFIRIVVPDLFLYARQYVEAVVSADGGLSSEEIALSAADRLLGIVGMQPGVMSERNPHRWMYDFYSLSRFLRMAGFADVKRRAYGEGRVPDLEIVDTRPEDSLHVEAQRV